MNKRLLLIVFILATMASFPWAKADDLLTPEESAWLKQHAPIKVGAFNDYPPFGFVAEDGRAQGISVDYWTRLAGKLGFDVVFSPTHFNGQLEGLKKGEYDSLAGIFPLEERAEYFDFSRHYMDINTYIFIQAQSSKEPAGLNDLKETKVGVVKGDSGQVLCEAAGLKPEGFKDYPDAIKTLAAGGLDAIVMDELVVYYVLTQNNLRDRVKRVGLPVDQGHMTLPVKKGNQVLLDILNKGIAQFSPSELGEIAEKWLR
ncbi:MAG: amino acid ABC transporter substrate-binding protein [Deltaproteobacteria bacterium]|nr:amino acid ABC transporter substrate-binding protein [Deltaproteobacteria bacterium]